MLQNTDWTLVLRIHTDMEGSAIGVGLNAVVVQGTRR